MENRKAALAAGAIAALCLLACGCAKTEKNSSSAYTPACGWTQSSTEGESEMKETENPGFLTPEKAKARMDSGDEIVILDVRTEQEYAEGHIPGSVLITDSLLPERAAQCLPDLDAEILVYCRSGRRSAAAAQVLAEMGYSNVWDFGGILDWPYEVEREEEQGT
ncbi:MAG: rhodanese-like domain-containing protein [Oscillospiraceae bacterium]|nr:rhodanese-like domain-containing protein [Oscillospiraceae bacterium]